MSLAVLIVISLWAVTVGSSDNYGTEDFEDELDELDGT